MLSGALQRIKKNERGAFDVDDLPSAAARDGRRASDDHDALHRALGERGAVLGHRSAYAAGPLRAVAA